MIPVKQKAFGVGFVVLGAFFLLLDVVDFASRFADASDTHQESGVVVRVDPPGSNSDTVTLQVRTPHAVLPVPTDSEVPSDYTPGERVGVLVANSGWRVVLDGGNGRYASSMAAGGGGALALLIGWGSLRLRRYLLAAEDPAATTAEAPAVPTE